MKKRLIICVIPLFLGECFPPENKYTKFSRNLWYKIHTMHTNGLNSQAPVTSTSIVFANIYLFDNSGKVVVADTHNIMINMSSATLLPAELRNFLLTLQVGDSCSVLLSGTLADSSALTALLGKKKLYDPVRMDIKIADIIEERDFIRKMFAENSSTREENMIKYILSRYGKTPQECYKDGIYILELKRGYGALPRPGSTVIMHYKGYLPNGFVFDNTWDRNAPFDWTAGTPDQLIPGLEKTVMMLRNNGYARVLIPSHLAFGKEGSTSGLVPPNTPVIYEVWVLWVIP